MSAGPSAAHPAPSAAEPAVLAGLLIGVAEQTRRAFEETAAAFDLTPPQARALLALDGRAPMRSLADSLHCDASNVTGIADRLEAQELVERQADPDDRRVKLLVLTDRGAQVRAELTERIAFASPVMARLSAEERAALRGLLGRLIDDGGVGCAPV